VHNPVQEGPSFLQPVTFSVITGKVTGSFKEKGTRNKKQSGHCKRESCLIKIFDLLHGWQDFF